MLDSRPTTNGVIMCGKMTTSRMGIIGSLRVSNFSLDVVTNAPKAASGVWHLGLSLVYQGQQVRMYTRTKLRAGHGPTQPPRSTEFLSHYPAFSIMVSETLRFSTISRVTSNSFT